jgi:hypothetical protein
MPKYFYSEKRPDDRTTLRSVRIEVSDGDEIDRDDALVILLDLIDDRLCDIRDALWDKL